MHQIRCKKELKARSRFEKRMKHRAAGKRDSSPPEVSSNSKLAQALASCKLDTQTLGPKVSSHMTIPASSILVRGRARVRLRVKVRVRVIARVRLGLELGLALNLALTRTEP